MKDEHHIHRKRKLYFLLAFSSLVLMLSGISAQAQIQQNRTSGGNPPRSITYTRL